MTDADQAHTPSQIAHSRERDGGPEKTVQPYGVVQEPEMCLRWIKSRP